MLYHSLIQRLFEINLSGGIKLGLHNVQQLQKLLNFPDHQFTSIHIAGTNGKGSVSTKIALAFESAGYRVGLYTSPHISCFRERIQINRQMIPEEKVVFHLQQLFQLIEKEKIPATFFELTTLLALLYFAEQKVDIAVLETGLGGRLDATNIVTPCLSLITSISLDHTEILGTTLEEITKEKAGIIKEHIPVIIGPHVPFEIVQEIANRYHTTCQQVNHQGVLFEEENRAIAQAALEKLSLNFKLSPEAILQGLKGKQPCRFEVIESSPCIILDVAHNPDGLQHLMQTIECYYPKHSLRFLFGLSKNKDIETCLKLIAKKSTHFHLVEAPNGRGASVLDLNQGLQALKIKACNISMHDSIKLGIKLALQEAKKYHEILVVCGSFFIMAEVREALGFCEPRDNMDLNEKMIQLNRH